MVNTVKLATYGIQDTSIHKKQDKDKQTGNIGYTRHLHTQDRQTNWQHWVYKTPPYTRQRQTKKNQKTKHNMG